MAKLKYLSNFDYFFNNLMPFLACWIVTAPNWKHFSCLIGEQTKWCEGSKCIWCHGLLFHIHPWLLLQIGVGKNVLQKCCKIGGIKCKLWISATIPLQEWDKFYMRAWSWLKGELPQGHVQFDMKCDLVQYENKVETIVKIYI